MRVIKTLRSRRYAVTFIILIIISLVLATTIPQRNRVSEAEWFHFRSNYPELVKIIKTTGLDHIYTTWWFLTIVGLFSLNIGLNLSERVRFSFRQFHDERQIGASQIETMPLKSRISTTRINGSIWEQVEDILKGFRYRVKRYADGLFATKGRIGYWWVPMFHGGLLIILLGVLVSGVFRFSATFEISEGQQFHGRDEDFLNRWYGLVKHRPKMDFILTLKKYRVEYWDVKRPKLYQSIIEIKDKDGIVFTRVVEMNKPLRYRGYSFYQTKYWGYSALFGLMKRNGHDEERGYVNLPYQADYSGKTLKQDFIIPGPGFQAFLEYEPSESGIISMEIKDGLKTVYTGRLKKEETVELNDRRLKFYGIVKWTGMYVSSDPGVVVVYIGFALLVLSSLGMVFIYPRKLWVGVNGDSVIIGADTGRRREEFRGEFEKIVNRLKGVVS